MKKGLSLVEVLIAIVLASAILLIILVSTVTINRISSILYRKYEISLRSKILLNRITKELAKNSPPAANQHPIIRLNNDRIEFFSVRITSDLTGTRITPIIITLTVSCTPSGKGFLYILRKRETDLQGNVLEDTTSNFFIESETSSFEFANVSNIAVRVNIRNQFTLRNKRHEIHYKVDVPINIK